MSYTARQTVHISGWECGTEIELTMVVDFTVTNERPQTLESPAEPARAEVSKARFFDGKDELKLPWSIEDRITSSEGFQLWLLSEAAETDEYARDQATDARREELRMERGI